MARGRGAAAVFLEVRESNQAARALYEKWAFLESGRRPRYYKDPEEDAILIALFILFNLHYGRCNLVHYEKSFICGNRIEALGGLW